MELTDFSPGALFANLIVSGVGYFLFSYGRKTADLRKVVTGVVLMIYPYFVSSMTAVIGIAVTLVAGLWVFETYG